MLPAAAKFDGTDNLTGLHSLLAQTTMIKGLKLFFEIGVGEKRLPTLRFFADHDFIADGNNTFR
jgi:hypothetical protein